MLEFLFLFFFFNLLLLLFFIMLTAIEVLVVICEFLCRENEEY
jgi:hypothetical protein